MGYNPPNQQFDRSFQAAPMSWPHVRSAMAPDYAEMSDDALQEMFSRHVPGLDIEQADEIFGSLASIGRGIARGIQTAMPHVANSLSSVANGALTGAMAGGPIGALAGAGAGLATGVASSVARQVGGSTGRTLQSIAGVGSSLMNVAGGGKGGIASSLLQQLPQLMSGKGGLGAAIPQLLQGSAGSGVGQALQQLAGPLLGQRMGQGGSAAQSLLGLLARPEMQQSLAASSLGRLGAQTIPVAARLPSGAQQISSAQTGALLSLLAQRAQEALDEWSEFAAADGENEYIESASGEDSDVADPAFRNAHLENWLAAAELIEAAGIVDEAYVRVENESVDADAWMADAYEGEAWDDASGAEDAWGEWDGEALYVSAYGQA